MNKKTKTNSTSSTTKKSDKKTSTNANDIAEYINQDSRASNKPKKISEPIIKPRTKAKTKTITYMRTDEDSSINERDDDSEEVIHKKSTTKANGKGKRKDYSSEESSELLSENSPPKKHKNDQREPSLSKSILLQRVLASQDMMSIALGNLWTYLAKNHKCYNPKKPLTLPNNTNNNAGKDFFVQTCNKDKHLKYNVTEVPMVRKGVLELSVLRLPQNQQESDCIIHLSSKL